MRYLALEQWVFDLIDDSCSRDDAYVETFKKLKDTQCKGKDCEINIDTVVALTKKSLAEKAQNDKDFARALARTNKKTPNAKAPTNYGKTAKKVAGKVYDVAYEYGEDIIPGHEYMLDRKDPGGDLINKLGEKVLDKFGIPIP